jgi:hypothetical protein
MSLVVAANFPDGVVLGADTTVTLPGPPLDYGEPLPPNVMHGGILKVFEGRETLFSLGNRPIGVAIYGTPVIGNRSVESYLHEFVVSDPGGVISGETPIQAIAQELTKFFARLHEAIVVPSAEAFRKRPYDQIPQDQRPGFGFVLGGYSANSYLGETWLVFVPVNEEPTPLRQPGEYSINWFGIIDPIERYLRGYSQALVNELREYVEKERGSGFSDKEQQALNAILAKAEYVLPTTAMPVAVGIELVKFLLELVTNHFRFTVGASFVAGRPKIGKVTYMDRTFEVIERGRGL